MGGFGSGRWYRWNKQATVEDALCLDINSLKKQGLVKWDVSAASCNLYWRSTRDENAKPTASISYSLDTINPHQAYMELRYNSNDEPYKYRVALDYTEAHYGGKRMWFRCPLSRGGIACNRRVAKLYKPAGSNYFGCRKCFDLKYYSQMTTAHDYAIHKAWEYNAKMGGEGDLYFCSKPKGMHYKTHKKLHDKMEAARNTADWHFARAFGFNALDS